MTKDVIGIDESGKGDYFGPLVAAGVHVRAKEVGSLLKLGVRDSKKVSDAKALELDRRIRRTCVHEVVAIGPERYNSLYEKIKNLNRMLAWAHARVLENLLDRVSCEYAMADKFGDERFIQNALMKKGRKIRLEQRVRAEEEEIAVAAASIVARAEFLRRLESLSGEFRVTLPKGAGPQVDETARSIVGRYGVEALERVAKMHFKTTKKILGDS